MIYHKVPAVAKLLDVSPNAIYSEIRRGTLQVTHVGRLVRISDEQLAEYLKLAAGQGKAGAA